VIVYFFFFQAEDGIRDFHVTGVQTCALPILEEISNLTGVPLVLHGGTGIPLKDIQKAISLGTAKINVNTENQMAQTKVVRQVLRSEERRVGKECRYRWSPEN